MANVDVIPTAQNLPDGACFTSWQDAVNAFAAALRVTLPSDYGQIIISETEPDPVDRDKIWFKVDNSGRILSIRSWDSTAPGSWEPVDKPVWYCGATAGAANTYTAFTVDVYPSTTALTAGHTFIATINAANTGAATLSVNGLTAAAVTDGLDPLVAGQLLQDQTYQFLWDGTRFRVLNPSDIPAERITVAQYVYQQPAGTPLIPIPAGNNTIPFATSLLTQSWASLGGGGAVTLQPGTYHITATLSITEDGSTSGAAGQLVILNGATAINWHDFIVNNVGDSTNPTCITVLTVADATTASITCQVFIQAGGGAQYGASTPSARAERLASLTIMKLP